jgi:two-component system phosphate regulon sensor histidine kinase PhoR
MTAVRPHEALKARLQRFGVRRETSHLPILASGLALIVLAVAGPGPALATCAGMVAAWGLSLLVPAAPESRPRPDAPHEGTPARETPPAPPATERLVLAATPGPWRDIIDALPDPALAVDQDHNVVHANQPASNLFPAVRRGASIGLASRHPALLEALEQVITLRETRNVQIQDSIPVERRLDVAVAPLPPGATSGARALLVLRDVSERERLAQTRADFIANASHELRTPLAAVRGFIETLQGPAQNDTRARERFLAIMAGESARMTRILDDLLSLSRVEMRAHIAPSARIDITETLEDVIATMEPVAETAHTTLKLEPTDGPRLVRADRDEIVQVFVNLIQNAIKYGRPEGTVIVRASDETAGGRRRLRVAVIDDGPGIAAEHIPRLTERFYRVDVKSSRERGGTGLGLAIVKHILNRHGAELRIRSKVGAGSVFAVDLPLIET